MGGTKQRVSFGIFIKCISDHSRPQFIECVGQANWPIRRNTGLISSVLVNKDGVAGFPGFSCVACGPHNDKAEGDHMKVDRNVWAVEFNQVQLKQWLI